MIRMGVSSGFGRNRSKRSQKSSFFSCPSHHLLPSWKSTARALPPNLPMIRCVSLYCRLRHKSLIGKMGSNGMQRDAKLSKGQWAGTLSAHRSKLRSRQVLIMHLGWLAGLFWVHAGEWMWCGGSYFFSLGIFVQCRSGC